MTDLRFIKDDLAELERLIKETRKRENDYLKILKKHATPDGEQLTVDDIKDLTKKRESLKAIQRKRDSQYTEIWKHL